MIDTSCTGSCPSTWTIPLVGTERIRIRGGLRVIIPLLMLATTTAAPACDAVISELLASNGSTISDEDGDSSDWLEILNDCDVPVSLDGWFLTDCADEPMKWRLPPIELGPQEFLLVFCSGKDRADPESELHTNFNLSRSGEFLALLRPDTTIAWQFAPAFPAQRRDISYGYSHSPPEPIRTDRPRFFANPSPGSPNGTGVELPVSTPQPEVSLPGGVYFEDIAVELSTAAADSVVRYTLNGLEPTETSPIFSDPILLSSATELRAKTFSPGSLPSPTSIHHYVMVSPLLFDRTSDLPLVMVDTFGGLVEEDVPTRAQIHILERGSDGRAHVQDEPNFSGVGGIEIRGFSSVFRPKKSFNVEVWDAHGEDRDVEILGMPAESDWVLYGPYQFDRALIRNAFIYALSNQLGRYAVRTRFVETYLNMRRGQRTSQTDYVGVYVLMEKIKRGDDRVDVERLDPVDTEEPEITGGYIVQIDRVDVEEGDMGFHAGGHQFSYVYPRQTTITAAQIAWIQGFIDDFNATLVGPDFRDPVAGYAGFIDVDSFIDHHLLNEFAKNPDGFVLSTYMHKPRGGKLTAGPVWDFDRTMGPDEDGRAASPIGWSSNRLFGWYRRFFADPDFEARYRDRWLELRQGPFALANLHSIVDRMAAELEESQARNFSRWSLALGSSGWTGKIESLADWIAARVAWMDDVLLEPPTLSLDSGLVTPPAEVIITSSAAGGEVIYTINGPDPRRDDGSTDASAVVFDEPIVVAENTRIRARARFGGGAAWSPMAEGVYVVSTASVALTEIMYNPPGGTPFEFAELLNFGDAPVDLQGWMFDRGFDFDFAESFVLAPGEYTVIVNDLASFASRYDTSEIRVAGEYEGVLSNTAETVSLLGSSSEVLFEVQFKDDWFPETDGGGYSLVLVDPLSPRDTWGESSSWRASASIYGSPGAADSPAGGGQRPGDGNQDGVLNVTDAIHLLGALFGTLDVSLPCGSERGNILLLDADANGRLDTSDAVYNLMYLFRGGPPPQQGTACRTMPSCPEACTP